MQQNVYKSDRSFKLFDYSVKHGQLLLRSEKKGDYLKNIDIIFYDARYLQLFSAMENITIRLSTERTNGYPALDKYLGHEENRFFEIETNNVKYFIAASFVKVFENDLEFNETSLGFDVVKRGVLIGEVNRQ